MVNFKHTQQSHADYSTSAMEADTISKNGRNPKSHTSRGNFLKIFFVIAVLCCCFGCKKDKDSNKSKFTDEQIETLYQEIKIVADAVLLSDNPNWNSIVEQYKDREEIKEIEAHDNGLMIEFENKEVRGWLIPPPPLKIEWDMGKMQNLANGIPKRATVEKPKMLIVNALYHENRKDVISLISELPPMFEHSGWDVTVKENGTNMNFFEKGLAGYDVVFIIAHGFAGLDKTWIVTSEEAVGIVRKAIFNVLGQGISEYYAVSNTSINVSYSSGSFPNTMVYMVCCQGLKHETHLGKTFVDKGAKVVVGWDENNLRGAYSGLFLLEQMLNENCSLDDGVTFLRTLTLPTSYGSSITDFTYDDGDNDTSCFVYDAHLVFYPSTAGDYKLPINTSQDSVTFTISDATNISQNSATFNASVTSNLIVTDKGICYSLQNDTPTTADSKISKGSGTGNYSVTLIGLIEDTSYHVRPYAIANGETYYGEVKKFLH